uniref:Reverse transcriptase domain-containing protein n=1 Tax=Scleropages formosus TaxID=113540 RepID=A0A8C9R6H4_SCLFO
MSRTFIQVAFCCSFSPSTSPCPSPPLFTKLAIAMTLFFLVTVAVLSVIPLHVSDHFFIFFQPCLTTNPSPSSAPIVTFHRNLKSLSPSCLYPATLSALPSAAQFSDLSIDNSTNIFLSALSFSLDSLCPLISRPARPSAIQWLINALCDRRTKLQAAEQRWHKSKTCVGLDVYKELFSTFLSAVSSAKTTFFHNKIQPAIKKTIQTLHHFSCILCPLLPPSPSFLILNDFALFFRDKVKAIIDKFSTSPCPVCTGLPCKVTFSEFKLLSETEISDLLISHRATTCLLDLIPLTLLKTNFPQLSTFISKIINSLLSSGCFPSAVKTALISPLLKKPSLDPKSVQNYRPVSLLPSLSKTVERVACDQLSEFLTRNHLCDGYQSQFKVSHSTKTLLLAASHALRVARVASLSSDVILLYLFAAFDTVNHQILLSSLSQLGIKGTVLRWLETYLSDRSNQVVWRAPRSSPLSLSTGLLQGSVLGPLLFRNCTSSLGPVIASYGFNYHCFADDNQLFLSFPPGRSDISDHISACLLELSAWVSDHHLQLNLSKTEILNLPAGLSFCYGQTGQLTHFANLLG